MKRVVILPSTTGQGDLAVAQLIASTLNQEFHVTTAAFAQNEHSPIWHEIPGQRALLQQNSHPDHSRCYAAQVRSLAAELSRYSPDLVISLNEPSFALSAVFAGCPVIQVTHMIDPALTVAGRKVLTQALRFQALSHCLDSEEDAMRHLNAIDQSRMLALLRQLHSLAPLPLLQRTFRKLKAALSMGGNRTPAVLIHRYGRLLGTNYLSQLLCDEIIVHSIFVPEHKTLHVLNRDRKVLGKQPLSLTSSLPESSFVPNPVSVRSPAKKLLLTFGGIDHPVTNGFSRLIRILNGALQEFTASELQVLIAGRVTITKRDFFLQSFAQNPFFLNGGITLMGNLGHSEHLLLLKQADLVMAQPGYSTLCELVAAAKPFVLFYGLAAYYEQFSNFRSAAHAGLSISPGDTPWLQVGEYNLFASTKPPREALLVLQLKEILSRLCRGTLPTPRPPRDGTAPPHFLDPLLRKAQNLTRTNHANHEPRLTL